MCAGTHGNKRTPLGVFPKDSATIFLLFDFFILFYILKNYFGFETEFHIHLEWPVIPRDSSVFVTLVQGLEGFFTTSNFICFFNVSYWN